MRPLVLILLGGILAVVPTGPASATPTSCADLEVIAHRGYHVPHDLDENSAGAFQGAIDRGYSIETDVWADADGTLWMFHDRDVSRATGGTGFIDDLSTPEVAALRYSKGGSPLLTFQDAMTDYFEANPTTRVYIEPKQATTATIVADAIVNSGRSSTTWITGFTTYAHRAEPAVQLAEKQYDGDLESPESLRARGVNIVALVPSDLTEENVDRYHNGSTGRVEVQDRDANTPGEWQNTIDAGADGQLTDKPDDLKAYCESGQILPSVTSVDPSSGQPGTTVTITGSDFQNTTGVQFGGVSAGFVLDSDTQITAVAPAGMPAEAEVVVTTVAGPSDNPKVFDVPPVITGVTPSAGPAGTAVVIDGTTLGETTAVTFGGKQAAFTVESPTRLTTAVPAGTYGVVAVVVTTPGGRTQTPTFFDAGEKPAGAKTVPQTTIRSETPSVLLSHSVKINFTTPGATAYECRLDGEDRPCPAPRIRLRHLSPGDHTFSVRASSAAGADPTDQTWRFTVPVDDQKMHADGNWTRFRAPGAFGKSVSVTSSRDSALTHRISRARSIWIIVTTAPTDGDLRVYLGDRLLKTVHTKGKPQVRVVRVARTHKRMSGLLRLVAGSDARVSVDGFAVSRRR